MDLKFLTAQVCKKTKYYTKLLRFICRYSDGDIRDLAILKNFNMLNTPKTRNIGVMAFITTVENKPIIYINTKDWPKNNLSLCKAVLLHEIGHFKTGMAIKKAHVKEFEAQNWAMNRCKTMYNNKKIYRGLLLNLFLWGLQKNFDKPYRKASKLAFNKGIINRATMDEIFIGNASKLDKVFNRYLKNTSYLRV
jgi:hypothetical protein